MNPPLSGIAYSLDNVWQRATPEQEAEVRRFWQDSGLRLNDARLEQRCRQLVLIARNLQQNVIGVCTAYKTFARGLNNYVYMYRTMVNADYRRSGMAIDMLETTRDFFNERFRSGIDAECVGLMFVLENPELGAAIRRAVCPRTGFIFMGFNRKGQQVRLFYFDDARI